MIPLGDDVASHKLYLQQLRGGVLTPFENFMKERFVFDIEILRDQVPHQLYIAGGSVLHYTKRRGTPENIARQDGFYQNTDCDIYVHERHELAVRQALVNQMGVYVPRPQEGVNPANGQPNDYYNIHAPAPANFFRRNFQEQLRRNNIGVVSNVMFGDKKVQIVGVIDDYPIEDVIRNFDFTICSLAYNLRTREFEPFQKQGEDVLADINNNVMHIRKNYIKFLMAPDLFGARLTKQRYEKYTRRGFRFIYPTRDDFVAVVMQTLEIGRDPGAQEDE